MVRTNGEVPCWCSYVRKEVWNQSFGCNRKAVLEGDPRKAAGGGGGYLSVGLDMVEDA